MAKVKIIKKFLFTDEAYKHHMYDVGLCELPDELVDHWFVKEHLDQDYLLMHPVQQVEKKSEPVSDATPVKAPGHHGCEAPVEEPTRAPEVSGEKENDGKPVTDVQFTEQLNNI